MTIVRVGATQSYSEGWEAAFTKGKKKAELAPAAAKGKATAKAAKPSPKKKKATKKGKK